MSVLSPGREDDGDLFSGPEPNWAAIYRAALLADEGLAAVEAAIGPCPPSGLFTSGAKTQDQLRGEWYAAAHRWIRAQFLTGVNTSQTMRNPSRTPCRLCGQAGRVLLDGRCMGRCPGGEARP